MLVYLAAGYISILDTDVGHQQISPPYSSKKTIFVFQHRNGWLLEYVEFESLEGLGDPGVENYSQYRSYFFRPSKLSSHFESKSHNDMIESSTS